MKRSEALKLLLNRYESCLDSSVGDTFEGIMDALLDECINNIGMLPPTIEVGDSGDMPTKDLLDYSEIDYEIKWEPEDEC